MKQAGKIAAFLAVALAVDAGLRAEDVVLPGNPYAPVVARNVFGLNPITAVDTSQAPDPPAKITPNGIMSIFGHLQVLFKVSGATKDGKPASDQSYILSEGQRQDDIEVKHIDQKAGIVTFDNHGIVQTLALANAPASSTPMPASTPFQNFASPASTVGGGGNNSTGFGRFGSRGGRNRSNGNGNDNSNGGISGGMNDSSNLRTVPTRSNAGQPQMTAEENAILIEAQRQQYINEGNPAAKIMPPAPGMSAPGDPPSP
jgi:hypothetical protein